MPAANGIQPKGIKRRRLRLEYLEARSLLAGDLRFVSYNVHATDNSFGRGNGLPSSDLGTVLQAIGNEVTNGLARPVDLVALQEVRSQSTTTADVVSQLNAIYGGGIYARGALNGDASSGLDTVGIVYNTQTLDLLGEAAIGTASSTGQPRQTLRYRLRPDGGTAATEFYIYVSHFKSSDGPEDMARRELEAEAIRADADALGQGVNIIYAGDFNLQESAEDAYQDLLAAGSGQAFDPLNSPGTWHTNNFFRAILTQTPSLNPVNPNFTGGGLDDRFDFQLISGELTNGTGLEYLTGSYHTFGNNGAVPVNGNINDASNTALPGLANRTTILNLLTTVSDHLPVVADYHAPLAPPAATVQFTAASQSVNEGTASVTITAQLSAVASQNVSMPFTLSGTAAGSGGDYTLATSSPLTITAGNLSAFITINLVNDTLDEPSETIIVTMGTPTNAGVGTTIVHTATIADNDLLRVSLVTPTSSGFQVEFNGAVNAASVNLYDQNGVYGSSDATLVGATTGIIRGSLVWNAAGNQATFVRTGGYQIASNSFGTLPVDSYTVTLRSGASGFIGAHGDQLDGNANGIGGVDYSTSFAVSPTAANIVTLSLPDFARGYGQAVNVPAEVASGIPITVSRGAGLTSVAFALQYDAALLTIGSVTKGAGVAADAVLSTVGSTPGQLVVSLTSPTQLSFFNAPFTLLNIAANVPTTAPYTEKQLLTINGAAVSAGVTSLPVAADPGLHVAAFFGDVDASRTYNSADLPALQRVLTGSNTGFGAYRAADPLILADLSRDGALKSDDASLVYRLIQSLTIAGVPALPAGIVPLPPTGTDPRISVPQNIVAHAGEIVQVPVWLEATDPRVITLQAADLALTYDPAALSVLRIRGGSLLGSAARSYGPARPGELELHAWSSQGAIELRPGDRGTLVIIEMLVADDATGRLAINLVHGSGARTAVYDAELTSLVLQPEPTESASDEIDGLITILAAEQNRLRHHRKPPGRPFGPLPLTRAVSGKTNFTHS